MPVSAPGLDIRGNTYEMRLLPLATCIIEVNDLKYLYWASDVVESRSTTSLRFVFRHQIVDVGRQEEEEVEDFDGTKLEVNDEEQESESARD
ncbi:hypothetical protein Tco_0226664 [Tanacetum coccineum]